MAKYFSDIQKLLNEHLNSIVNLPEVAWENTGYKEDENTLFIQPHLVPADSNNIYIGSNVPTLETGRYVINIFGLRGEGWYNPYEWVDTITDNFKEGTILSGININVRLEKASPRPGFHNDKGKFVVPVSISYKVYM